MSLLPSRILGRSLTERLFRPASVAVLGMERPEGAAVLANLRAGGFAGRIQAAATGQKLEQAPDLAVLAVAEAEIAPALAALGAQGCTAAIVTGPAPPGLAGLAQAAGMRVLGPGSFGIAVPGIGLNATSAHLAPLPGRVALVSQSAALCRAVLDWAEPNGVGFSHIAGIGGNADIGFGLVLDWLSRDAGTGAILLDIRRLKDRRAFLSAARAASRLRPVVALRAGGRLADPSGMADAVFDAALHRAGVLSVAGFDELLAAATTLTRARPPRNEALAIVTNAIGPGRMAADAALREGLALAELSPQTRMLLHLAGPTGGAAGAPVHVPTDQPIRLAEVAALLGGAAEVGGILVVHAPTGPADAAGMEALAAAAASLRVPLLVCAMGEVSGAAHRRRLAAARLPVFASPEQAVRGFLHLVRQRRATAAARELPPGDILPIAPDRPAVAALVAAAQAAGRDALTRPEAMAVLAAYGIDCLPEQEARTEDEAAQAAATLFYPVALKRIMTGAPPGAVGVAAGLALDLEDEPALRAAARAMLARPDGAGALLIQPMLRRARELAVAVADDAVFGPYITFGLGGTAADVLDDRACDLPPLNLPLAHALIARTRAGRLLAGFRDAPPADEAAVARLLVRVSQLLVDVPELASLRLAPVFATAQGVRVASARIALRPPGQLARLAIPPYPAQLARTMDMQGGEGGGQPVTIRPIRPEDAEAHAEFFRHLTPEDVRYRFFTTLRELTAEQIARMTQVDYEREIAFIATRDTGAGHGETLGVARLVREGSVGAGGSGEFAVLIRSDLKGRGLASALMRSIIAWARAQGMDGMDGQILSENAPMLGFIRRLGFTIRRVPEEPELLEARLDLKAPITGP